MKDQPVVGYPALSFSGEPETRRERLQSVWRDVLRQAAHFGNTRLWCRVAELHDYKGILEVHWLETPADGEKGFFAKAWENHHEPAGCVEHRGP